MNFLKGIVDGILATDLEGSGGRVRYQYDPDDPDNDSEGFSRNDPLQHRTSSNDNVIMTNSVAQLSELYRAERDNLLNSLVLRYGEGCVQQLWQLLKSNHETVLTLSQQLQKNVAAVNEVNSKLESAAVEHLRLQNENNSLFQQLNLLSSENMSLKSQLTQAGITIRSNENHVATLNELLKENRNTFENMRNRCGEFYKFKAEIEELKKKLAFAESHVTMLKKERAEYWSDPKHVLGDEDFKRRIAEALEREDRAIAVAKVMASQSLSTPMHAQPEPAEPTSEPDGTALAELRLKLERLEDENAHLKEINDSMHTMYADLSKALKETKTGYLKESIETLSSYLPAKMRPVQLVFVQPTGVLDLDFDPNSLHQFSHTSQPTQTPIPPLNTTQHSSQSFHSSGQSFSSDFQSTGESVFSQAFKASESPSFTLAPKEPEKPVKKASPKLNFRSKVIKYVTSLDGPPAQPEAPKPQPPLQLDPLSSIGPLESQFHSIEPAASAPTDRSHDRTNKSSNWNSDWDFFDEDPSETPNEPLSKPSTTAPERPLDDFDFILQEEHTQSHTLNTNAETMLGTNPPLVEPDMLPQPSDLGPAPEPPQTPNLAQSQPEEDVFDSIINEEIQEAKPEPPKSKGWDDIDFDDEMFQA